MESANTGTPVQQNMSAIEAIAYQYGIHNIYTQEDRNAAWGRHTVQQLDVSEGNSSDVMFAGAEGGAVTTGAAKSLAEFSWTIADLAGTTARICALSKLVTQQQMTPLQHAAYELVQIRKIKDSLMATKMGSSEFEANGYEVYVLQELAKKYNEPCRILRMLWSGAYSPMLVNDTAAFTSALLRMLGDEYHMSGTEGDDENAWQIMGCLVGLLLVKNPAQHPGFQNLAEQRGVPQEMRNELAELMFQSSQIINESRYPGTLPAKTLYRKRCKENYVYYMNRLELDEASLENDVRILKIMKRENLQAPPKTPPSQPKDGSLTAPIYLSMSTRSYLSYIRRSEFHKTPLTFIVPVLRANDAQD